MIKSRTLLNRTLATSALAPLALALVFGASPAFAQVVPEAAQQPTTSGVPSTTVTSETPNSQGAAGDAIVVTGSRIQSANMTSAAPIAVVSQEEFKLRGAVNVESVLNELPSVVPGFTAFSNNPGTGAATLNLRNLGAERTLVLVNGRRYMFFDTSQEVDLNTIPTFLIQSVDVVTGGASAVYGSDAVAGVVNFHLRNLKGFEMGTQYGVTGQGDGQRWDTHLALGGEFADGRGHATVYGDYYQRRAIFQGDRSFSRDTYSDDGDGGFAIGGSSTGNSGRFHATGTGLSNNFTTAFGATFDTPGGASRPFTTNDYFNYAPQNYLQTPQKRWLVGGYGDYEINDHVTAYTEVSFSNNRTSEALAATPVTGTFNVNLAANEKYFDAADFATLGQIAVAQGTPGEVQLSINRRVQEVGLRLAENERNAYRALFGFKGDITDKIHYDAYYMYAHTRNSNVEEGNVSRSAFQDGLDAGTLDIFGPGGIDAAGVSSISILAQNQDISNLQVASADINGSLFNLGMGADDVAFAVGAEYRSVSSRFIPDTALSSGDVIGFDAAAATAGGYHVVEEFGELRVPLIANKPFVKLLELHGAARYSQYSLSGVGNVWTYAGDVKWAPIQDITFRAQYQHAVRAPNVNELYGGATQGFPTASDPCGSAAALTAGALKNACIATGVPVAILTPTATDATPNAGLASYQQIETNFAGNPDLKAERSNSYTFGAIIAPRFIPRFHLSADYFNIKVKGAITALDGGAAEILGLCYGGSAQAAACQNATQARNPDTGEIDGSQAADGHLYVLQAPNANAGSLHEVGIDVQADYSVPLGFGLMGSSSKLNFSALGTWTKTDTTEYPGGFEVKCAGKFGTQCGDPHAKYKTNVRASYLDGGMTLSFEWHHLSAVHDDDDSTLYTVEKLKAYNTYDLAVSYDVSDNFNLTMGVNNLLDKTPPIIGSNQQQANTYPSTYDVLGRDFFVSAGVKF